MTLACQKTVGGLALLAALSLVPSSGAKAADGPAEFTITTRLVATNTPPIGANEFGDCGGTAYSAGNLIPDSGFEPIMIRRYWRATQAGTNWAELDAGGITDWDLVQGGFLSGASVRVYRIVDANGDSLPQRDNYLDLTRADRFVKLREGRVIPAGAPGYPEGGWVATRYAQPAKVYGTRSSASFVDAQWVTTNVTYHYIVTAVSDASTTDLNRVVESDPSTAAEVSATPEAGLASGPRVYVPEGDALAEIPRASAGNWFAFRPRVANATGTIRWALVDPQDQPVVLPAGLSFNGTTGELSGTPTATPGPLPLRFRVTAANGADTRDFVLNEPIWAVSPDTQRPAAPLDVRAEAGPGFVRLTWSPSPSTNVVGYRVYRSTAPRATQVNRVYLEGDGPALVKDDYLLFDLRVLAGRSEWSHPRVRDLTGRVGETWRVDGGGANVLLSRAPHGAGLPPAFRFPGDTCLQVEAFGAGSRAITGPAIFYPAKNDGEANWYGQLEPGKSYRYEAWMRQEGLGNSGRVELTFHQIYTAIKQAFVVTNQWCLYSFEFVAPARPTSGWHGMPRINFTGPGALWVDNLRLFRFDTPEQRTADFVPSPLVFDELMAAQPLTGPKGILRSMGVLLNTSSMKGNLSYHRDASLTLDWYQAVSAPGNMTLPFFLECARRTGDQPANRMRPWLNVASFNSEAEWLALVEYLGAAVDPANPADVAAKPWAYLRYQQRGVTTPWTDEFERILLEFANETWHNRAVTPLWFGWGPAFGVHQGGLEFGLFARYVTETIARDCPVWTSERLAEKLHFVMGSNYSDYAERGVPRAPRVRAVGHTTYVGPKWETGETPNAVFNDHGVQGTLLGYIAGTARELEAYRRHRETLAAQGQPVETLGYEGGPSGYSLPGTAPAAQVEISEQYGKSLAMGVAALDAWLGSHEAGFTENAQLAFAQGGYWSSHTLVKDGYRRHAGWLALILRNRCASGRMVRVLCDATPTMTWDGAEHPLVGCHAFRDGSRLSVITLSRKLGGVRDGRDYGDGSIRVTLRLPAAPRGMAEEWVLTDDPRANNRDALRLSLQTNRVVISQVHTFTLPQGSIYAFSVDTDLPADDSAPPTPQGLRVRQESAVTTLAWEPASGASHYRIYRSAAPQFRLDQATLTLVTTNTSWTDEEGVGGSVFYYRVAAGRGSAESPPVLVAVGGANSAAPLFPAPATQSVGEGDAALQVIWLPVASASGYRVGFANQPGGPYTWREAGNEALWTLRGLTNGLTYYVVVHAYGAGGRGPNGAERSGVPRAPGGRQALVAWDFGALTSYETNSFPSRFALGLGLAPLTRGAGLAPGDTGYHPMTSAFGFLPRTDNANFGAAGGGSLANAVTRNLCVGFTVSPPLGRRISLSRLVTGAIYPYSNRPLRARWRGRVGSQPFTDLGGEWPVTVETHTPTELEADLSAIPFLQDTDQRVELRLYFYSPGTDARWCRAGLKRATQPSLVLEGSLTAAPPVALEVRPQGGSLELSFPVGDLYGLKTTTNLIPPVDWRAWTGAGNTSGGRLYYPVEPADPQRFFRLDSL